MVMANIIYQNYERHHERAVVDICHKTGYMGEDCTGRFDDVTLFGYLFCTYYLRYEPDNCFVAIDKGSEKVVGYIIGTLDAGGYPKAFSRKMKWRIVARMVFLTSWRHPRDFRQVLDWNKHDSSEESHLPDDKFKAHLHINILPGYQRHGIGKKLIELFENRLRSQNIGGVYLGTSNHNTKALGFYEKNGFKLHMEKPDQFWRGVTDYKSMVFTKEIK